MLVKIKARILIFPGTDFHFRSTSVPPGTFFRLCDQLHWLDVPDRVFFRLAVTVHQCLNGRAPPYLSQHCIPVSSADTRRGICVPPTVIYLPYRVSGSALTAVGRSQLLAQWPGTHSRNFIRDPTSSTDCFRRLFITYLFARY